jgi:hypothetical protein
VVEQVVRGLAEQSRSISSHVGDKVTTREGVAAYLLIIWHDADGVLGDAVRHSKRAAARGGVSESLSKLVFQGSIRGKHNASHW